MPQDKRSLGPEDPVENKRTPALGCQPLDFKGRDEYTFISLKLLFFGLHNSQPNIIVTDIALINVGYYLSHEYNYLMYLMYVLPLDCVPHEGRDHVCLAQCILKAQASAMHTAGTP